MNKSKVFLFNTHDLPRRAGEMREYSLDIPAPMRFGIDVIAVAEDQGIHIEMRLDAVGEGVLVGASVSSIAEGECIRCLEPVELPISRYFQELYRYAPEKAHTKAQRRAAEAQDDLDEDEDLMVDGDLINLEGPIRDAIVLALPINPLCEVNCPGLCPGCGVKWSLLEAEHRHDAKDPRWAGLDELDFESQTRFQDLEGLGDT
jgi:uncharacterized protein